MIKTVRVNGFEMWQVVKDGQVVRQFWSKAGLVTWLLEQKK